MTMTRSIDRRDFLKLAGIGGVVFASGLYPEFGLAASKRKPGMPAEDFFFVQLSDTHWGFEGAPNPEAKVTLKKAVAAVNSLEQPPDFIVFTGDLTHTTDDPAVRRKRLAEFQEIVSHLHVKDLRFMPGEHDASLDQGKAYQEFFGHTHYTFDHKGLHFIVLDNVSDPGGMLGEAQLDWLATDLKERSKHDNIIVFTHRPLFDLYPQWDWMTRDGGEAIKLLSPFKRVTVFYGHIHQEHHHVTGNIHHHAAKSLIFPLPAPGSQPKKGPLPWDPAAPYKGLGFRRVNTRMARGQYTVAEMPVPEG
jgi:3',5'-cyclic AMP phosphodiesterase CpdA